MNATTPPPPAPGDIAAAERTRLWAGVSAALFPPVALAAALVTLTSDGTARCLTYGEQCGSPMPWWLFALTVGLAGVACIVALAVSAPKVRRVAFAAQLLAECAALVVILDHG